MKLPSDWKQRRNLADNRRKLNARKSKMAYNSADNPFWNYSILVWKQESVREALLKAQSTHAIDINLLLFCSWCALEASNVSNIRQQCMEVSRYWQQEYLVPLRLLRSKSEADSLITLKQSLLDLELHCEREEQFQLWQLASSQDHHRLDLELRLKENLTSIGYAEVYKLLTNKVKTELL